MTLGLPRPAASAALPINMTPTALSCASSPTPSLRACLPLRCPAPSGRHLGPPIRRAASPAAQAGLARAQPASGSQGAYLGSGGRGRGQRYRRLGRRRCRWPPVPPPPQPLGRPQPAVCQLLDRDAVHAAQVWGWVGGDGMQLRVCGWLRLGRSLRCTLPGLLSTIKCSIVNTLRAHLTPLCPFPQGPALQLAGAGKSLQVGPLASIAHPPCTPFPLFCPTVGWGWATPFSCLSCFANCPAV